MKLKLKLKNYPIKALGVYVEFIKDCILTEKSKIEKASIRIAEINAELYIIREIYHKLSTKLYANIENKSRSVTFKPHEALVLVKYQKAYEMSLCKDLYTEHILNYHFPLLWKELLK